MCVPKKECWHGGVVHCEMSSGVEYGTDDTCEEGRSVGSCAVLLHNPLKTEYAAEAGKPSEVCLRFQGWVVCRSMMRW